ncbi:MAG: alpha/beta hydrolase [Chloroflexi bacterium]|nr:alpha/beta hydrolase [Chloroflexota bacterium]
MIVHRGATRLVCDDVGTGPVLLFLHAFPLNRHMWRPQVEYLKSVARCLTLDWRGFGESDSAPDPYPMEMMAGDALAVLDAVGVQRAVVVGLSMGGYAALALAELAPQRLQGLVLASTKAEPDSEEVREARCAQRELVLRNGVPSLVPAQLPRLVSAAAAEDLKHWVRDMILDTSVSGAVGALRGMEQRSDRTQVLSQLHYPSLFIAGHDDAVTPPAVVAAMARISPRGKMIELKRAGHLSNLEAPEQFCAALRSFLTIAQDCRDTSSRKD